MKGRTIFILVMLVSSFLAFLFTASQATATPVLQLTDGTTTITIADGSEFDANSLAGVVTFISDPRIPESMIPGWIINVTTGIVYSYTVPELDLNSVDVSSSGASSLTIALSDTDFKLPGSAIFSIGGTTSSGVSASAYYGIDLFQLSTQIGSPLDFFPTAFSGEASGSISSSLYSLTEIITIQPGHATSFNASLKVPEPGTVLLLGIGFAGVGLYRRYKREA